MSVSPDRGDDLAPEQDLEQWQALSREEQAERLIEKHHEETAADLAADVGTEPPAWDQYDGEAQSDTIDALRQSADETWTAEVWQGIDDRMTIPFEVHRLTKAQQNEMEERFQVIMTLQDSEAEDAEELREELGDDADDFFDTIEDVADWMNEFLAEATVEEPFTAEAFERGSLADGTPIPRGTDLQLLSEIYLHYQEEMQRAQSFRRERR